MSDRSIEGKSGSHIEAGAAPLGPVTKKQKAARHCKRFWWAWLLAFCIFVVVIMIIVVYAILPAIAQKKVDQSELTINGLEIRKPTPDSFSVSVYSSLDVGHGSANHARLEDMDVDVYIKGLHDPIQPFMTLPIDGFSGGGIKEVNRVDHPISITNMGALDEFAKYLMENETLSFSMTGETKLWIGKLHTNVDYNEDITTPGLNKLKGMAIKKYGLIKEPDANMNGKVLIPNPTVVTLEMGDVNLDIAIGDKHYGTGVIPNLILTPGNNQYDFRAMIEPSKVLQLALEINKKSKLTVGSNGTSINGVPISWLSKPLQAMKVEVPFEVDEAH